jgi:hypothetical protein
MDNMSSYASPPVVLGCQVTTVASATTLPDGEWKYYPLSLASLITVTGFNNYSSFNSAGTTINISRTNVRVGDWISNTTLGLAWQIVDKEDSNDGITSTYTVVDVDGFCSSTNMKNAPDPGRGYIFRLNENGVPILSSPGVTGTPGPKWETDLMAHFAARNPKTHYVSDYKASHGFAVGDPIC